MNKKIFGMLLLMGLLLDAVNGQNPYQSIGKPLPKGKMLTLSNGKFQEFFPNDTLVPIGSVMYNTVTGQVVAFLTRDTMYAEYNLEPEVASRWLSPDPLALEYSSHSPYVYVLNRPTVAIDPDGKRVYFVGGANNDQDGWNYINRWGQAFANQGIGFQRVDASHGKLGDVMFTSERRHEFNIYDMHIMYGSSNAIAAAQSAELIQNPRVENQIEKALDFYRNDLKDNPLKEGEQLNLAGYSYGSVMQAQVALQLAKEGKVIDNLILIGSPISDKSPLWKELTTNKNIKNVIRYDIKGDLLSNPQDILTFLKGGVQNAPVVGDGENGHHFDAARPGIETDKLIQTIVTWLKQQGVKN
ncbi:MAG: hypothetical protein RLZZ628_2158 [Bacteroidota bacterium]|jgi:pimeloyl-ACP methyl ester carboxylesterase